MSRHHWKSIFALTVLVLGLIVLVTPCVDAAPIVHGAFFGTNVDYLGVQEESATDPVQGSFPGPGLFGPPTVAGDNMDFNPAAFSAFSSGGGAPDNTDSNLQFTVMSHTGKSISAINFAEAGDTALSGLSGEAQTTVSMIVTPEITQRVIGGVLTNVSINLPQVVMTFNPKNNFLRTVDGTIPIGWTGNATLDLSAYGNTVTKVFISLDNHLSAASQATTSAFIQKKDADALTITVTTGEIPEPSTVVIAMLAAVIGGVFFRHCK